MMNRASGFTLLEVVITIALFLIMFLALVNFFASSNSTFYYDKSFVDTAQGASNAMTAIAAYVLPADQVLVSHTFSSGTFSSGSTTLVLEVPAVDSSGSVVSSAYDYVAFYRSGTSLYRLVQANASSARSSGTKLLSGAVNSLTFTYNSADYTAANQVNVDIQTQSVSRSTTIGDHLYEQFHLRNSSI